VIECEGVVEWLSDRAVVAYEGVKEECSFIR
jgi:hypothetical protein